MIQAAIAMHWLKGVWDIRAKRCACIPTRSKLKGVADVRLADGTYVLLKFIGMRLPLPVEKILLSALRV